MERLEDPRVHRLMVHLGKKIDGKYTRRSLAAEKLNEYLVQVEKRLKDLEDANAEIARLTAEYERLTHRIKHRERLHWELKTSIVEHNADVMGQNPRADRAMLERQGQAMLEEFEKEHRAALVRVEDLKQTITLKKTAARRHEDRIDFYRKKADMMLRESEAA